MHGVLCGARGGTRWRRNGMHHLLRLRLSIELIATIVMPTTAVYGVLSSQTFPCFLDAVGAKILAFFCFYCAMHFSAKRSIAIVCCLTVCLSVCLSVRDAVHCGS